jgi:segregation and condensation protein B
MELSQIKRIVEAALLASAQPLTVPQLMALFVEPEIPSHDELGRALEELAADCAERGVELKEVASGFRYQVRQDVHAWIARLWTERQTKYSRALLETLSLIAYRQPITRGEIEQIRGVAVSSNIVKTLEEREWVRVVGYRDVPGKPELFGTTRHFLDYFNLRSLDELPPLAEIRDVDELDVQMTLAPVSAETTAEDEADVSAADGEGADGRTADRQAADLEPAVGEAADREAAAGEPLADAEADGNAEEMGAREDAPEQMT